MAPLVHHALPGHMRLAHQRTVAAEDPAVDGVLDGRVGESLLHDACASAEASSGHPIGCFYAGAAADWLVLDRDAPQFAGATIEDTVDRWIFSGNRPLVREAHVAGERVVHEGRHLDRDGIASRYTQAMKTLLA